MKALEIPLRFEIERKDLGVHVSGSYALLDEARIIMISLLLQLWDYPSVKRSYFDPLDVGGQR